MGLKKWNDNVQKNEDKSRVLSNQLLEKQIKDLTPIEKNERVKENIKESENLIDKKDISKQIYKTKISKYFEIQNFAYGKIKKVFDDYKVFEEVKIEKEQYDCIAVDVEEIRLDYIFEIKYYADIKLIRANLKSICLLVKKRQDSYRRNTKRYSRNVIIIIADKVNDKVKLENKKSFNIIDEMVTIEQGINKIMVTDTDKLESELKKFKDEMSNRDENMNKSQSQRIEFWNQFNNVVIERGKPFNVRKATADHWYNVAIGTSDAHIDITLVNKDSIIGVELYVTDNKDLFDKLYNRKDDIEKDLGFLLDWRRLDNSKASRIIYHIKGLNFNDHSNYNELMNKTIDIAVLMRNVFKKYL